MLPGLLLAQGNLTFVGPVVGGNDARGPAQLLPMRNLKVIVTFENPTTTAVSIQTLYTNASGQIAIPTGFVPRIAMISGPQSPQFHVKRPYMIGTQTVWISETVVADYSLVPTAVDISTLPGTLTPYGLTVADCSAFENAQRARSALQALDGSGGAQLMVHFQQGSPFPYTPASYSQDAPERINLWTILGLTYQSPDDCFAARSLSTIAHEYGHRILSYAYAAGPIPRVEEGLCDFLASVVTGSSQIGLGVDAPGQVIRDIESEAQFNPWLTDKYAASLAISGALYHARERFALQGSVAQFDALLPGLLAASPIDEQGILCHLLQQLGTTQDAWLLQAFARHGIVPQAGGCAGSGIPAGVFAVSSGFGSGLAAAPSLAATSSGGSFAMQVQGGAPNALAGLVVSNPPMAPLPFAGGSAFVDLPSLMPLWLFGLNGQGSGALNFLLPAGLGPYAMNVLVLDAAAPTGFVLSNGLFVQG